MEKEKNYSNLRLKLVLKYYWEVIRRYKVSFFTVLILTIFYSVLDVYIPLQYLKLWDILSTNDFTVVEAAKFIIIFILILKLFAWVMRRISGFSLAYFESKVKAGLREQAFSYIIEHSHSFFANNFSGSLTQKISKYANAFEKLTDKISQDGLPLLVRSIGMIIAIYTLLPKYSYILGIFCVVFLLTAFIYTRYKLKYDVLASIADSKTTGVLADAIGNHSSIQFFTGYQYEKKHAGDVIEEQQKATILNWYLWEGLTVIQSFYIVITEFIIFWIAIGDWQISLITLPVMILLQTYFVRLGDNLWSFAGIVRTYYDGIANAQEMALIFDTPYEIIDKATGSIKNIKGEVVFDNVTYIYKNNNSKVLDNFSLTIPAGQKIAIIGSSGAGKTTFVRLLMRLFNLIDGRITIDGINISIDNDLSDGKGVVRVLKGQKSYLGWKNIASTTNYFFKVFAYTNSGILVDYNTTAAPSTSAYVLKSQPTIILEGVYTHFSSAKNPAFPFTTFSQIEQFKKAIGLFESAGF
ncbi:MAG: ABC transporter-related protein, partial [Parcubacteria group bacterium GW2011_GWD2_35_7]